MVVQVALCGADAIFLQVALDNAGDVAHVEVDSAKGALREARVIEAKARDWLSFGQPADPPSEEQLARGMSLYECGDSEDLKQAVNRLRAKCS